MVVLHGSRLINSWNSLTNYTRLLVGLVLQFVDVDILFLPFDQKLNLLLILWSYGSTLLLPFPLYKHFLLHRISNNTALLLLMRNHIAFISHFTLNNFLSANTHKRLWMLHNFLLLIHLSQ